MRYRPLSPDGLVDACADAVAALPGRRVVAIDGADEAEPAALAERLARRLRADGRAADGFDCGCVLGALRVIEDDDTGR